MVTPQLTDYIRTQLKQGVGKEAVRAQLLSNGWQAADVEMAFNAVYAEQPTIPGPTPSFSLVNHPKSHGNKTLPVMVLSVLGLALLAGSAFAYPYVFPPAPEKVVEDMFAKMPEVRSFGYKLGLKSGISETSAVPGFGSIGAVDVSLDLDGAIDLNDLNSINNAVALDLKVGATSPSLQFSINLGLEEMNMGSDVYLRLTKIPTLPLPIDLSPLLNQWVKLDAKTYIAQSGLGEQLSSERDLSAEQKEKIAELRGKIIKITGKLPSESISGVSTYHYAFEMDKIALSSSIVEISSILGNAMSDDQIAAFNKGLESVQSMGGEIWIGKGDRLLYKTILNVAFSATNDSNPIQTLAISYEAGDYNEPVQIEVPESTKTLEEVLTGFSS